MLQTDIQTEPIVHDTIEAIQDRKGRDITLIDLRQLDTRDTQMLIICTGNTPTQVAAIADNIREHVQQTAGQKPYNYDGYRNSTWIVIDYGFLMVHVFVPDARNFYSIEQLWSDGVITEVENID
ncbi:MAG: ribosome silencing factor [Muribaculaceae bacterium]|jgi:ribosome-associated protein|nr:ribosome silencing factor [Muribaculaceae bacterium]